LQEPLYIRLGEAFAIEVSALPLLFDDGDIVGAGSGRATYHGLRALERLMRERHRYFRAGVQVISLSANVHSGPGNTGRWLNANDHAVLLAGCFELDLETRLEPKQVPYPLAFDNPHFQQTFREQTCLGNTFWEKNVISHGIIGVGTMAPDHKFYVAARARGVDVESNLEPVQKDLKRLVELCDQIVSDGYRSYSPVADTSNRLIYVPPPPRYKVVGTPKSVSELQALLEAINERLLSVTTQQLAKVKTLILLAASKEKAPAILELVRNYHVRFICIDKDAAVELLRLQHLSETTKRAV
jgi:DNA-binding transcriptional regulator LsrR (DeoR family)